LFGYLKKKKITALVKNIRHAHMAEERGKKRKLPMVYLQFFGGLLFVSSDACHQLSGVLCCPDLVGYGDTILVQLFIDRSKVYISTGLVTSEFCAALGDKAYDVTWKELRARGAGGIRAW
jgi:hypothetical protein